MASDGERIKDGTDPATGYFYESLYGIRLKPGT